MATAPRSSDQLLSRLLQGQERMAKQIAQVEEQATQLLIQNGQLQKKLDAVEKALRRRSYLR